MQTYRVEIHPVSPGTRSAETANNLNPGTGQFAKSPVGPVVATLDMTAAQIVGLQGYIERIKAAANTSSVETAITNLTPT